MIEDLIYKFLGKLDGHSSRRNTTTEQDKQIQPQIAFSSHWSCLLDETMVDSSETDWLRNLREKNIQHVKRLIFKQLIF
jgi:hypothetical protein